MRHALAWIPIIMFAPIAGCLHHSPGVLNASSNEPLSAAQLELREEFSRDIEALTIDIGPRSAADSVRSILAAEQWLVQELAAHGIETRRDEVDLGGVTVANIEACFPGSERPDEIVVLGAHYDTVVGSPGANDNASGVALLLATARRLRDVSLDCTVRLVFFVNEENPFSFGVQMGSRVYAERARARNDDIVAMISVDSVGSYSSEPGRQRYPAFITGLPRTANFIAFASNFENRHLLDRVVATYQEESRFPSIGVAMGSKRVTRGDHAPFWWQGYPAVAMTDTSEYRDPHYHRPTDTIDKLNLDEMARMGDGFVRVVVALASTETLSQ